VAKVIVHNCMYVQSSCTTVVHNKAQNDSDNLPLIFQTITTAQMTSVEGCGAVM